MSGGQPTSGGLRHPFGGALYALTDEGNVRVDDGMGLRDAMSLGWTLRGAQPTTATVPTARFITDRGDDVGGTGVFRPDGSWSEGELREADPQFCGWIAGDRVIRRGFDKKSDHS